MRLFQFLCVMLLFAFGILINAFAENEEPSDQETTKVILVGEPQATADAAMFLATPNDIVIFQKQESTCSNFCPLLSEEHFVPLDIDRSDTDFLTPSFLPTAQRSYPQISVKDRTSHKAKVVPTKSIRFPLRISMR